MCVCVCSRLLITKASNIELRSVKHKNLVTCAKYKSLSISAHAAIFDRSHRSGKRVVLEKSHIIFLQFASVGRIPVFFPSLARSLVHSLSFTHTIRSLSLTHTETFWIPVSSSLFLLLAVHTHIITFSFLSLSYRSNSFNNI